MRQNSLLRALGTEFLDLLFPQECLGCGLARTWLCNNCYSEIITRRDFPCISCGRPTLNGETHPSCRTNKTVDGVLVATYHTELISELVHAFKYDRLQEVCEIFSRLLLQKVDQAPLGSMLLLNNETVLLPVPLHRTRAWDRGFNQTELLARHLQRVCHLQGNQVACESVVRNRFTPSQTTLKRRKRIRNLDGAFSVKDDRAIRGKTVIIIDDVITTGTTIFELTRVLKQAGAREVWALVLTWN